MVQVAVDLFTELMQYAIPVAVVFELGNIVVCTFMRVAFGGRLWFGRGER